jgi:hypothetical protein
MIFNKRVADSRCRASLVLSALYAGTAIIHSVTGLVIPDTRDEEVLLAVQTKDTSTLAPSTTQSYVTSLPLDNIPYLHNSIYAIGRTQTPQRKQLRIRADTEAPEVATQEAVVMVPTSQSAGQRQSQTASGPSSEPTEGSSGGQGQQSQTQEAVSSPSSTAQPSNDHPSSAPSPSSPSQNSVSTATVTATATPTSLSNPNPNPTASVTQSSSSLASSSSSSAASPSQTKVHSFKGKKQNTLIVALLSTTIALGIILATLAAIFCTRRRRRLREYKLRKEAEANSFPVPGPRTAPPGTPQTAVEADSGTPVYHEAYSPVSPEMRHDNGEIKTPLSAATTVTVNPEKRVELEAVHYAELPG